MHETLHPIHPVIKLENQINPTSLTIDSIKIHLPGTPIQRSQILFSFSAFQAHILQENSPFQTSPLPQLQQLTICPAQITSPPKFKQNTKNTPTTQEFTPPHDNFKEERIFCSTQKNSISSETSKNSNSTQINAITQDNLSSIQLKFPFSTQNHSYKRNYSHSQLRINSYATIPFSTQNQLT